MIRFAAALALIVGAAAVIFVIYERAGSNRPVFGLPVDCMIGARCYIQSHVDRDPGPGAADYTCGSLSYDGHKGTDFRVATFADMKKGVDVLAVAHGTVRAVRDGVGDTGAGDFPVGQECGNAVALTHDDGWETQYCHLARDTVSVRPGDAVRAGDRLGRIGFSGNTEFPHLHLSVRKDGEPMDPFGAQSMTNDCAEPEANTLWSPEALAELAYRPGGVVDLGMTDAPPKLSAIREGGQAVLPQASATTLIMWARFFGVRAGDLLTIRLTGPEGDIVESETRMDRNRAEEMRFAGKKSGAGWRKGVYTAIATIHRADKVYDQRRQNFTLN